MAAFGRTRSLPGRLRVFEPQSHKLPEATMWLVTALTAAIMAVLNFLTLWSIWYLVSWKFRAMQAAVDAWGVGPGIIVYIAASTGFATACVGLVFAAAPSAGSSGAPENKGWLNGGAAAGFFTPRNMAVRAGAMLLANAAGYPVGREGPSVTMGSNLAFLVTRAIARPLVEQWVDVDDTGTCRMPALVVDEERLSHAQRIAGAVGGACAMAMIFDAPVGGVLYMFEEITVTSWPLELTFRAFAGTMACTMVSYCLLDLCGTSLKAFVLYEWSARQNMWSWWDMPGFILIALILGPFSAYHTRAALAVGSFRQQVHAALQSWQPYAKMAEAVLYAVFCGCVCGLVSLLATCDAHYKKQPHVELDYVRYNCEEGAYNSVASLLLTTSEGALRRLFSTRNTGDIYPANTGLALAAYTVLNICMTGVPVPSGNFTGTMLIGGLVGRFVGSLVRLFWHERDELACSGVYAMVGSAAMLCGFKQISLAVVVFIVEAGNDLSLTTPLMMSVTISLLLNRLFLKSGFDEEQILRKNIPFLPPEPPPGLSRVPALELCDLLPATAVLPPDAPVAAVRRALEQLEVSSFPVVRGSGVCLGFVTRARLEAALGACSGTSPGGVLAVKRLMDSVPYMILEDAVVPLFYALFAKAGASVVCVVSVEGEFRGMITRNSVIAATRRPEEEEGPPSEGEGEGEEEELLGIRGGLRVPLRWFRSRNIVVA